MEKLELKHLQNYPMNEDTGLLVQTCTRTTSESGLPMGYKTGRLIGVSDRTDCEILFDKDDFAEDYDLDQIKPILRPLSDLTKDIEVNGKKFVPMLHLTGIAFEKWNRHSFILEDDFVKLSVDKAYTFHFDKTDISFDCRVHYNGHKWDRNCYVPNQLELFQKLYEWHFDINGLIEKGLAIDINTL